MKSHQPKVIYQDISTISYLSKIIGQEWFFENCILKVIKQNLLS